MATDITCLDFEEYFVISFKDKMDFFSICAYFLLNFPHLYS